ncbi:MAG: S41 family peptidase [Planctomycetota bacterium]
MRLHRVSHRPSRVGFATLLRGRVAAAGLLAASAALFAEEPLDDARLLRFPDIHGDAIVFVYAGDLWTVPASGGAARRLTSGEGLELFPRFSPDGKWIAYTGHDDGSSDVYVIPAEGGMPRRLTWYPSRVNSDRMGWDNMVIDWTPDSKILFRSQRGPIGGFVGEPYAVSPEGGPAERFPLPECGLLSFAPDGKRIAYNRVFRNFRTWKRYRGGMAQDVWIYDLEKRALERLTDWEGTDTEPLWIGRSIYFVSDREGGRRNLWRCDVESREAERVTDFRDFDVAWAQAGTGRIVFEAGGALYLYDPAGGAPVRVRVRVPDDRRFARKRWRDVADSISEYALAPGGKRALFVARGEIFTVPAKEGDVRNVTRTPGARERAVSWSPDGRWIACISDESGEEEIRVIPQAGGEPVTVAPGEATSRFQPAWSPDSKKLAWADRKLRLWYAGIEEKVPVLVETAEVGEIREYAWSPDSMWIAFTKVTGDEISTLYLYSLDARASAPLTDGATRCYDPAFDPAGGYLYFLSDRDLNPILGSLELSFAARRMTRPYALLLRSDLRSPLAPRSDEAQAAAAEKHASERGGASLPGHEGPFRIDLQGIEERTVALPVPAGEYAGLRAAKGKAFYLALPVAAFGESVGSSAALKVYDLVERKEATILEGIDGYDLSPDGGHAIYKRGGSFGIVEAKGGANAEEGRLEFALHVELDPESEWRQIFREVWRRQRDYFYLPDLGQIDWDEVRVRYESLLPHVSHRYDLTYVLGDMVGELATGHTYVGGGDYPRPARVPVGVLGADLQFDEAAGLWRIARILTPGRWAEGVRSPLAEPGIGVREGDYVLAIDGRDLGPREDPYRDLVHKVGRAVELAVSPRADRGGARTVTVHPIDDESSLRYRDWVERNRLAVDRATGGRAGYIHIPDMQARGLREFIRQYYPQLRREGLIVDVRYNGGGFISQMVLERLRRVLVGMVAPRDARPDTVPPAVFHGPMVCLVNQYSASDGDLFPHYFRKYGLGPLIGRRTWGGVVGIRGYGDLTDGGYATVPEFGHYEAEGWIIENRGVEPDIEVDNLPGDEMAGRDAQLERAVEEILRLIEERKPELPPRPPSKDLRPPPRE